jgi:hypothetical protein
MLKKLMVATMLIVLGCGEEKSDSKPSDTNTGKVKDASTRDARGGSEDDDEEEADASTDEPSNDRDAGGGNVIDGKPEVVDNGKPNAIDDAGSIEVAQPDGGTVVITPGQDGGAQLGGMGSCCSAHDNAGCNNADLMVCVCEKDVTCCTKSWGPGCAAIVNSRFCQEGVRECVCDPNGKVGQEKCCSEWTRTCDVYAQGQCEALPGCF